MNDRRFEERVAELEAEAAESEALAAKCFQESVQFESELKVAKARLAEAEKERDRAYAEIDANLTSTGVRCVSEKTEVDDRFATLAVVMSRYRHGAEADAAKIADLSARIRELEGALRPFIEPNVALIGEPGTVGSVVTLEQFARAARALKGEG